MESQVYSVLFQFNHGIEEAPAALDALEKMELETPKYVQQIRVRFREVTANANSRFTERVSKQEIRKQLECERERRQQDDQMNPAQIYHRVEHAEYVRRALDLPPRALERYLTENIHFGLEEEYLAGLNLYYEKAAADGLIPRFRPLEFAGAGSRQAPVSSSAVRRGV